MNNDHALVRTAILALGSLAVAALAAVLLPNYIFHRPPPGRGPPPLAELLQVKVFFSTFTSVLLLVLLTTYARIYRNLPNRFTMSLLLFTVSLTLYALTANPLIALLFGFNPPGGLGPFTFLPDMFASVSVIILLYQSYK
ncbi:hypothetical protein [Haladaptatus sp. DYF46]|uniref:hypothetical protein n=1 Tax=Haladaptatus sp. DYF46 TaxID=2886041 RepID=UPI001E5D4560|nr:hypothetical protein [Haladaptatus sp. DYF46]